MFYTSRNIHHSLDSIIWIYVAIDVRSCEQPPVVVCVIIVTAQVSGCFQNVFLTILNEEHQYRVISLTSLTVLFIVIVRILVWKYLSIKYQILMQTLQDYQ